MNHTLPLPDLLDDPATREADAQAVMERLNSGRPLDPAIAARVRARSERATEEMRRKLGVVDLAVDLIHQSREEE
jgi:hypothetical protein